jgi:hypothetical protein
MCTPFWNAGKLPAEWLHTNLAAIPAAPETTLCGIATGIAMLLTVRRRR